MKASYISEPLHRGKASSTPSNGLNGHHSNGHGHSHHSDKPLLPTSSSSHPPSRARLWSQRLVLISVILLLSGTGLLGYWSLERALTFLHSLLQPSPDTPAPALPPSIPYTAPVPFVDPWTPPGKSFPANFTPPFYPRPSTGLPATTSKAYFWCRPTINGVQQMSFIYLPMPPLPGHPENSWKTVAALYEVDVDMVSGLIALIIWDRPQQTPSHTKRNGQPYTIPRYMDVVQAVPATLEYLWEQARTGQLRCHVVQAGQAERDLSDPLHPSLQWSRPNVTRIAHNNWNWMECFFDPALGPPLSLQLLHFDNTTGQWTAFEKTICQFEMPHAFASGLIKGLYNDAPLHLQLIYDYVGYCLRLGIDFFYVIDQTPDQELLVPFQPLIARGLVQYLYWPDADGIRVQFAQTQVYAIWTAKHTRYAYPADIDEYIILPTTPFTPRLCLLEPCDSPLKRLLTSRRYAKWAALEMFSVVYPMWDVPAELRAKHPEDDFRYLHNESFYREMAYHGHRTDPSYLPHQTRAIWHSVLAPYDNDRKTIYQTANVTQVRTHDVFTFKHRKDVLDNVRNQQYFDDIHIAHYRHIFNVRQLQLASDNAPQFWDKAVRDTTVADIMLTVPYPTPMADFLSLYPICEGQGWENGVPVPCERTPERWGDD